MKDDWQGLITQYTYDGACGFGLFIDDKGFINFYAGNGGEFNADWMHLSTAPALILPSTYPLPWYHIVGVWDGSTNTASLWVNGAPSGCWQHKPGFALTPGQAPLRLGAYGDGKDSASPYTKYCLDGDLAMPAIYNYALTPDQIAQRFAGLGLQRPALDGLLGCWPMTEERGDRLADISRFNRNGRIINHATWMIGGPSFNGSLVQRYTPPTIPPPTRREATDCASRPTTCSTAGGASHRRTRSRSTRNPASMPGAYSTVTTRFMMSLSSSKNRAAPNRTCSCSAQPTPGPPTIPIPSQTRPRPFRSLRAVPDARS